MAHEELELFVHSQGAKPRVIKAPTGDVLRDVLIRFETEDGVDKHAPVDVTLTVEVLELKRHRHIHVHKCRHVAVEVNFNGKTKRRRFSPAATVGVVAHWARKKFHLDAAAAAEYVLQLCNSLDRPRPATHLGELTQPPKCAVCFDLVKEVTPQG
jgi:hypothetical protein